MFAQCSNCDSVFRVTQKQLDAHDGLVRCGQCREVFNATWNLVDEIPVVNPAQPVISSIASNTGFIGGAALAEAAKVRTQPKTETAPTSAPDRAGGKEKTGSSNVAKRASDETEIDGYAEDNMLGEWSPISAADDQLQLNFGDTGQTGVYLRDEQMAVDAPTEEIATIDAQGEPQLAGNNEFAEDPQFADIDDATDEVAVETEQAQEPVLESGDTEDDEDLVESDAFAESVEGEHPAQLPEEQKSTSLDEIESEDETDSATDERASTWSGPDEKNQRTGQADELEPGEALIEPSARLDAESESGGDSHARRPDRVWHDNELDGSGDDDTLAELADTGGETDFEPQPFDDLPSLRATPADTGDTMEANAETDQQWDDGNTEAAENNFDVGTEFDAWRDDDTPDLGGFDESESPELEAPVLIAQEWYESARQEPKLEPIALGEEDTGGEDLEGARLTNGARENTESARVDRLIDESVHAPGEYFDEVGQDSEFTDTNNYENNGENQRQVISDLDPEHAGFDPKDVNWVVLHGRNPLRTALWAAGCLLLLGMLVLQVRSVHFDQIAGVPELRPYLVTFCKFANCDVPNRRDARLIELSQTRVTLHPENPGALRVSASLTNLAAFEQSFPSLQLTLTDKSGRIVGRRVYQPVEYLGTENASTPMPTDTLQDVVLDLAQPHETAVGFELAIAH